MSKKVEYEYRIFAELRYIGSDRVEGFATHIVGTPAKVKREAMATVIEEAGAAGLDRVRITEIKPLTNKVWD